MNKETFEIYLGELVSRGWVIGRLARDMGTVAVSTTWTVISGTSVTVGLTSFSPLEIIANLSADELGCSIIRAAVLMDDDQIINLYFHITVVEPIC